MAWLQLVRFLDVWSLLCEVLAKATIHAVKVLGDDGKGSDLGLAMAVDWIMTKASSVSP